MSPRNKNNEALRKQSDSSYLRPPHPARIPPVEACHLLLQSFNARDSLTIHRRRSPICSSRAFGSSLRPRGPFITPPPRRPEPSSQLQSSAVAPPPVSVTPVTPTTPSQPHVCSGFSLGLPKPAPAPLLPATTQTKEQNWAFSGLGAAIAAGTACACLDLKGGLL